VRASPAALDAIVDDVPLDPHFPQFLAFCRSRGVPVTVVSDGLDRVVTRMLAAAGIDVPVLANHLEWLGADRWRLNFPHFDGGCSAQAGNCKCAALGREAGTMRIMVGDGRSDFCAAQIADFVLAKGALAEHCQRAGTSYCVFGSFAGATVLLRDWLDALAGSLLADRGGSAHAPSA